MKTNTKQILQRTEKYVKEMLSGEGSGHDWWHIYRVLNTARHISEKEKGANIFIVELAALLHDIADRKFNGGDTKKGLEKVRSFLHTLNLELSIIEHVCEIIHTYSFSSSFIGNGKRREMKTLEGKIVQDADRLDAIGAIGIARAFAYGGHKGRELYNPTVKSTIATTSKEYVQGTSHTVNHFYEKLLLLKDLMNTTTAKEIARKRHMYMEQFLSEFYQEWDGKL
jgi:uncharacterized protein